MGINETPCDNPCAIYTDIASSCYRRCTNAISITALRNWKRQRGEVWTLNHLFTWKDGLGIEGTMSPWTVKSVVTSLPIHHVGQRSSRGRGGPRDELMCIFALQRPWISSLLYLDKIAAHLWTSGDTYNYRNPLHQNILPWNEDFRKMWSEKSFSWPELPPRQSHPHRNAPVISLLKSEMDKARVPCAP